MESTSSDRDQVIDPHPLGYFTDSLTGSEDLYLDAGFPLGRRDTQT